MIRADGPLSLATFMTICLTDPDHGYYTTRAALGAEGDFTTAPEISQMFGELLGLALAQAWIDRGRPTPFILAELGPGRGTLCADLLRAVKPVPGFLEAARLHLVEVSPAMRERQRHALPGFSPTWHAHVSDLPPGPLFLIANEFFDALPIRQFRFDGPLWRERVVGLDADGSLAFGWSPPVSPPELEGVAATPGDIVETSRPSLDVAHEVASRISAEGGLALIVDYGGWGSLGDTFQAVRDHKTADPLAEPGTADLTAHVDFKALATAARRAGAVTSPMVHQGAFLERLGITERARHLAKGLEGDAFASHVTAHRRLTHPAEMGHLFKVMSIYTESSPMPPGLEQ